MSAGEGFSVILVSDLGHFEISPGKGWSCKRRWNEFSTQYYSVPKPG